MVLVVAQIVAKKFHPFLYWATIVASTTFGTTMADFADRSLGIGYTGGSLVLFLCLMAVLGLWYWSMGSVSVETVSTPKVEAFYWAAITFSQTLGTALGDWIADDTSLGYGGGALIFGAGLAVLVAAYYWTDISRVLLFWAAFILTRPLGATVGDFLDKPLDHGGLALSRPIASAVLAAFIVACILILPQRAGGHPKWTRGRLECSRLFHGDPTKRRRKMLEELKKFALRGNVVDLAVGVIIGAAFGTIVTSLVGDVIMPIIGAITGGLDFSNYYLRYPRRCRLAFPTQTRKSRAPCSDGASF